MRSFTLWFTLVCVVISGVSSSAVLFAGGAGPVDLCISRKGSPDKPVRIRLEVRADHHEFDEEGRAEQIQFVDDPLYKTWMPDYYQRVAPPSRLQDCAGTVVESVLGVSGKYRVGSEKLYENILSVFGTEIKGRRALQPGDVVAWMRGELAGHVGFVESVNPVVVLTKDGDQAQYRHWVFKHDPTPGTGWLRQVDPLVNAYGPPRFFRLPLRHLRINISDPGGPCRGEVPNLLGMTIDEAEQAIRDVGLEPMGEEGDLRPLTEEERETVYEQEPQANSMLDDGGPVHFKWYPPAPGFQPDDGAKVAAKFSKAKVSEGTLPSTYLDELLAGNAGPRSAIGYSSFPPGGATLADQQKPQHTWVCKKFSKPLPARTAMEKLKEIWSKTEGSTWEGGFMRVHTSLKATNLVLEITAKFGVTPQTPELLTTSFTRVVLYRDQFILGYTLQQPTLEHDFSVEDKKILESSKALIDLRFPVRE